MCIHFLLSFFVDAHLSSRIFVIYGGEESKVSAVCKGRHRLRDRRVAWV